MLPRFSVLFPKSLGFETGQKQFAQKGDLQRGTPSVKLDGSSRTETRRTRGLQKREKVSRDQVARGADLGRRRRRRRRRPRQNLRRRSGREERGRAAAPRCLLLLCRSCSHRYNFALHLRGSRQEAEGAGEGIALHQRRVYIIGCT